MVIGLIALLAASRQAPVLTPDQTIKLPNEGRFDYMAVDTKNQRVFASHPAAKTLAVLDLKSGKISELDTTTAVNGVQIDPALNRIFVTGAGQELIALDRTTLQILKRVPLEGPGDDLAIDSKRQQIYVCHDDGEDVWVFDAKTFDKLGSVKVAGAPEYLEYDRKTDRLYQNIKPTDQLQVIDPVKKEVVVSWPTGQEKLPHGLALDRSTGRAFSAGGNGWLDVIDIKTQAVLATLPIVPKTDQIAFDEGLKRVYCAGNGFITVIQETPEGGKVLGNVESPTGAHTIAVDQVTHTVWICYSGATGAYFHSYKLNP